MSITVYFSPLLFVVSVNSDALRNEGRIGLMTMMSLLISSANIGFDYVLIAQLGMGVAGSAYGTALAQALALALILGFRLFGRTDLRLGSIFRHRLATAWGRILALGAPQSLGFVGLALVSGTIVGALQFTASEGYAITLSAYGIITRVMTFTYLPMLGLSFAMQTITGNNFGAGDIVRTRTSLRIAVSCALAYCILVELCLILFAPQIGAAFVKDPQVVSEVSRILPIMVSLYFLAGPLMMVSACFQAIGDAGRAAILALSKPYLFAIPLTILFATFIGEWGIWIAGPTAEILLACLTAIVLIRLAHKSALKRSIFI